MKCSYNLNWNIVIISADKKTIVAIVNLVVNFTNNTVSKQLILCHTGHNYVNETGNEYVLKGKYIGVDYFNILSSHQLLLSLYVELLRWISQELLHSTDSEWNTLARTARQTDGQTDRASSYPTIQ